MPYFRAISAQEKEALYSLLNYFFSSFKTNKYPLHEAILEDNLTRISSLLSNPYLFVDEFENNSFTSLSLSLSVILNRPHIVKLLAAQDRIHMDMPFKYKYNI